MSYPFGNPIFELKQKCSLLQPQLTWQKQSLISSVSEHPPQNKNIFSYQSENAHAFFAAAVSEPTSFPPTKEDLTGRHYRRTTTAGKLNWRRQTTRLPRTSAVTPKRFHRQWYFRPTTKPATEKSRLLQCDNSKNVSPASLFHSTTYSC